MADSQTLIDTNRDARPGLTPEGWLTDSWYLACPSKELKTGALLHRIMLDQPIVIGRTEAGEVFALRDICPHRLVPLSAGKQIETDGEPTVECPYHGWRFGTDGVCRMIPSVLEEQPYEAGRFKVRRYPVHEANGMVFVYIAHDPRFAGEPDVPPPDFGTLPGRPKFLIEEDVEAHMDEVVGGLDDPAGGAFLQSATGKHPSGGKETFEERSLRPYGFGWTAGPYKAAAGSLVNRVVFGPSVCRETIFQLPGFGWGIVENEKMRLVLLTCLTPVFARKTRITQVAWFRGALPLPGPALPRLKPAVRDFLPQGDGIADVQPEWYRTLKTEWAAARSEDRPFENPI